MENQNVKRGHGRPRVFSDEERKNIRKIIC